MAKIVYFTSPIDESKTKEIMTKGTLRYALRELGIEHEPLCVIINGMMPDELDLETVLDDTDIVEVRRLVHGGGDADVKRTLATVIQVAALVTVAFDPTATTANALLLIGSSIASGALNKWANDLMAGKAPQYKEQEISVQTSSYSVKNSSNKARPLSPIPVPIGSHRYAPDVHTDFFKFRYGWTGTSGFSTPYLSSFNPAVSNSNGPEAANNSWATMPANFMATGFPYYPIKIMPYGFTSKVGVPLTTSENNDIINDIKTSWDTPTHTNFNYNRVGFNINTAFPVVIYHHDPADPYRGRFNFLWSLARIQEYFTTIVPVGSAATRYSFMQNLFDGTAPASPLTFNFWNGGVSPDTMLTEILNGSSSTVALPSTMPTVDANIATMRTKWSNYLIALNGGAYSSTPKTGGTSTEMYFYDYGVTQTYEGIPTSSQLFNFGIGDMEVSKRFIGSIELTVQAGASAGYQPIDKTDVTLSNRWIVKPAFNSTVGSVPFRNTVTNFPSKAMINPAIISGLVPNTDQGTYNFNYYTGKVGQDNFKFSVQGRLYSTSSSGFGSNTTVMQIQWRWSSETQWRAFQNPVVSLTNANTQTIYLTYGLNSFNMGITDFSKIENEFLEVRIRKVNYDSSDNTGDKISELSIVDACFFPSDLSIFLREENLKNAPMNIDGLYTTALITDASTTNQYSALVESKCWVYNYDTDTWAWAKTRNPAFWFLYFARGGFLNIDSVGAYPPPYSPTLGWVNYPNHPNSTEHMFGGGYADEELDMDKILEWGFFCEDHELAIDMVIKDDTSVADTLERIANIGRASVSYYGGKLSVVIEDPEQVPVCMFGMANIKADSFAVDYAVSDPIRKVIGKFTDRTTWELNTVEAIVPFSDPENLKEIEITLDGITDIDQAQREVNIFAARQFYQRRSYSWDTDQEGYLARRGDLVYLSHDSTQYGFSGRVADFVLEGTTVIGIKVAAKIDPTISFISIRAPNGEIVTYACEYADEMIKFIDVYHYQEAPYFVNVKEENVGSNWFNSVAEDFIFIADVKSTTGKRVRISQVEASANGEFSIKAVDEDPAMWAYEFEDMLDPESFDDAEVVAEVSNVRFLDLGEGNIRVLWEVTGAEAVQIINLNTGLPLEANGQYSFTDGDIILDLTPGVQYKLEVRPLAYGTPFRAVNKEITVWPL